MDIWGVKRCSRLTEHEHYPKVFGILVLVGLMAFQGGLDMLDKGYCWKMLHCCWPELGVTFDQLVKYIKSSQDEKPDLP